MNLDHCLRDGAPPIVAILRGLQPEESEAIGAALVDAGIRIMEVPLNSPRPFDSIARLAQAFGQRCLVGAGTVLSVDAVDEVVNAGGQLIVTPNTNTAVIEHATKLGLDMMPGFVTPSEAFAAIAAGATRLKLFPATNLGAAYLKAIREVLPSGTQLWAVGGTSADNLAGWLDAGATGIGVGGSLFRPGDNAATVGERARALVAAWSQRHVLSS